MKWRMDEWTNGRTDGWTDGGTGGWSDGWSDGRSDGRMDGRTDGASYIEIFDATCRSIRLQKRGITISKMPLKTFHKIVSYCKKRIFSYFWRRRARWLGRMKVTLLERRFFYVLKKIGLTSAPERKMSKKYRNVRWKMIKSIFTRVPVVVWTWSGHNSKDQVFLYRFDLSLFIFGIFLILKCPIQYMAVYWLFSLQFEIKTLG